MGGVMIGVDPHKASVTIEVRDEREVLRATGRFPTDKAGYRQLQQYVRQWPRRTWAVEGARGVGRPLASRLLADGEAVVDVPAKLAARVRVFDTGQGRKTDATDAHAVAMVALRTYGRVVRSPHEGPRPAIPTPCHLVRPHSERATVVVYSPGDLRRRRLGRLAPRIAGDGTEIEPAAMSPVAEEGPPTPSCSGKGVGRVPRDALIVGLSDRGGEVSASIRVGGPTAVRRGQWH